MTWCRPSQVDTELRFSPAVLSLHDRLLRAYLHNKARDIEVALTSGWVLKLKGIKSSFNHGLPVPGYLVQVSK